MIRRLSVLACISLLPACGIASVLSRGHSDSSSTPKYSAVEDETSKFQAQQSFETWIVAMRGHLHEARDLNGKIEHNQCKPDCEEEARRLEQLRSRFKSLIGWGFEHAKSVTEHEQLATLLAAYSGTKGAGDLLDADVRFPKLVEAWTAAVNASLALHGPEQTAQETGKGACVVGELRDEPAPKGKKRTGPAFYARVAFEPGTTAHVHCAFPNPLPSYSRSKPDTFDVEVQIGDQIFKVTDLAATGGSDFDLPITRVTSNEALRTASWAAVHLRYRTHVKTGTRPIRDGSGATVSFEDAWENTTIASGELVVKLR